MKSREIVGYDSSIDTCYSICVILDMVAGRISSLEFDSTMSKWFKIADGFFAALSGSVDAFYNSASSSSQMNTSLMDSQIKQDEFKQLYKRDEYNSIKHNERQTWARIQQNNILNKLANMYTSNDSSKIKPIYTENNQGLQKTGIEGQLIEIAKYKKCIQQIAQSLTVIAAKNNTCSINTELLNMCQVSEDDITDYTLDNTETENYPKTLNELIKENYEEQNIIGLSLAVAICSVAGKVCSNIYNMIKEKHVSEIKEDKEKFEKCKSSILTIISYISSNSEKILYNKINEYVILKKDSQWWCSVFDKIDNKYDYDILYCLYNMRYTIKPSQPNFEKLYHSFQKNYISGDVYSLFQDPGDGLIITYINQSMDDIYIRSKTEIYTREDLISYSKLYKVVHQIIFYIARILDSEGLLYMLNLKLVFRDSPDYISIMEFVFGPDDDYYGYYIGDTETDLKFRNFTEFAQKYKSGKSALAREIKLIQEVVNTVKVMLHINDNKKPIVNVYIQNNTEFDQKDQQINKQM